MNFRWRMTGMLLIAAALILTVGCPRRNAPEAAFSASPLSGAAPLNVQFTDTSTPGSSPIDAWYWDFGDGAASSEPNPAHTYVNPGNYEVLLRVSAGNDQDTETKSDYIHVETALATVEISEFLAANAGGLQDEDGDNSDWIELHNTGAQAVSLANWALSDDLALPEKWRFPAVSLPAHGYLTVFASGKDRAPTNGSPLHTGFSLSKNGEWLGLANASGTIVDSFSPAYPGQITDISYGSLAGTAGYWYFETPTPGAPNQATGNYRGVAPTPAFNPRHGFYAPPLTVNMGAVKAGSVIRYTLDGSEPTEINGTLYSGPVSVMANTVVRARAFQTDYWPSTVVTATYILSAGDAVRSLPALCISGDEQESLFEPHGIMAIVGGHYENTGGPEYVWVPDTANDYNNPMQHGGEYERPVAIEYIQSSDNTGAEAGCGIRIHGGDPLRASFMRCDDWLTDFKCKFSFRLYFRERYGEEELEYPLFGDSPVTKFSSLVVRGGHNDAINPFIKDELARRLYGDMGREFIHGTFVNLFINGEYKAYYNLMERYDEDFFQSWIDKNDDWEIVDQEGIVEGSGEAWQNLINFADTNDLSSPALYQQVSSMLKVTMFIDYLILQLYIANADWPDNNWVVAREARVGGEFGFYVWDTENAFRPEYITANGFNQFPFDEGHGLNGQDNSLAKLYRALKANPDFRARWAERVQAHFFTAGGALTQENIQRRFDELRATLAGVLPDMETFIADQWIPMRQSIVVEHFVQEGLY